MPALDLLVVAELNLDVIVRTADGEIPWGQAETVVPDGLVTLGSSGAITAAAAARQGMTVAICAVVGDDDAGRLAIDALRRAGVDTARVRALPGRRTGMTVCLTRPDGDRALLTSLGTMADLTASDLSAEVLGAARHVHVSSPFLQTRLLPELADVLHRARAAGATTSVDTGWAPHDEWASIVPALGAVDTLLPNAEECRRLAAAASGDPAMLQADAEVAAEILAGHGCDVVVKSGGSGAFAVVGGQVIAARAAAVDPVDTTGAGDNFDAGWLAARVEGAPAAAALTRAVASGSFAVRGVGGTGAMATRDEAVAAAADLPVEVRRSASIRLVREHA